MVIDHIVCYQLLSHFRNMFALIFQFYAIKKVHQSAKWHCGPNCCSEFYLFVSHIRNKTYPSVCSLPLFTHTLRNVSDPMSVYMDIVMTVYFIHANDMVPRGSVAYIDKNQYLSDLNKLKKTYMCIPTFIEICGTG